MAISGTISASSARSRVKNFRRARGQGADGGFSSFRPAFCRRCSSRFAKGNFHNRQSRIAAIVSACDLDLNVWPVAGAIGDRFGQRFPAARFIGRAAAQGAVWTTGVIPTRKNIKPALNAAGRRGHERQPLPEFEGSEEPLDFAIKERRSHACANVADFALAHGFAELFAELRTIISDEKFRPAVLSGGAADQRRHIPGTGCSGIDLQRQELAGESIENRGDKDRGPQDAKLCNIAMPHLNGLPGSQQPIRIDTDWYFHWRSGLPPGLLRFGFAQQTLNGGAADLNSRPHEMPGDGACSEFRLRAEPMNLLRGPTHSVIQVIPYDGTVQKAASAFSFNCLNPRTNGILVDHKSPGGGFDIPVAQTRELNNGQPLFRRIVGPTVRRKALTTGAEDIQFPLQQCRFCDRMIPLNHQPQERRSRSGQPYARGLHGLGQHNSHGVNNSQCCGGINWHEIAPITENRSHPADGTTEAPAGGEELQAASPAGEENFSDITNSNGSTTSYDMFTKYTYNAQNMVTAVQRFDLADGTTAGLISGFSGPANTVTPSSVTYSYDANGNMTQLNRYSDLAITQLVASTAYSYNALNAPTAITTTINTASSPSTQSYSYGYDLGGRLTQQITPDGTSNFTYDHDNQLLSDSTGSGSYSYDSNGNRTSTNGVSSTVGANNQITSSGGHGSVYDNAGNLIVQSTSGVNTMYDWNNQNQLVTVNSFAGENLSNVSYYYSPQNQLIARYAATTVSSGTGSTLTQGYQVYVWDGNNLLAILNIDPVSDAPTVAQRFLMGTNENQILAQENAGSNSSAGAVLWAITDNNGSVVDVVNNGSGNAVLNHIVYDSFGNTTSQTNSSNTMLMGFDGYQYDSLTGLYYANARYYSPTLGRFISQDPSGFSAGDSNLYRFVGNHPTYSTDPTGLYEGGSSSNNFGGSSLIAPWLNLGGNTSTGSSPVSLTASQVNAGNQIINNAIGSGSYSAYGGIPMLTSATVGFGGCTASSNNTNPGGSDGISRQANLNIAIGGEALGETVQHPSDAAAIIGEAQLTEGLVNSTADAQWAQYTQADAAANENAIIQMQYANTPTPPSTHYMELNSPGWNQSGLQWLGTNAPVISSAVNLGVQVGLPEGQRSYSTIALDAGSLGLFGLGVPADTIGESLASGISSISGGLTDAATAAQQYAGAFSQGFSNADIQFTAGSGVGGEFVQRLNAGIQAAAGANAEDLQSGFQNIVSEQFPNGENQLAASKGFSGIGFTAEGVPDFAGTPYLYPVVEGQSNVVTTKLTGSRTADFEGANSAGGFSQTPAGYTWHHLGYDPVSGEGTLQLVQQGAHEATFPHFGGVSQYEAYNGVEYAR